MPALVMSGTVFMRQQGCVEGAGQDYFSLHCDLGIIEGHPANNASLGLVFPLPVSVSIDTAALVGTFNYQFTNLNISSMVAGGVYRDIICGAAGSTIVIHLILSQAIPWVVGNKLNMGIKLL